MDFCFINDWKSYMDNKSCPDNIIPIINYTFKNQSKQLVLNLGLKIISDWTFMNDSSVLQNNKELLYMLQNIINDSYYIFELHIVFIIINNIISDSHSNINLYNLENFIPRLYFCNKIHQEEWWFMISVYTLYEYNEQILQYICANIINGIYNDSYIYIIYKQCKLEPQKTINLLVKYNVFNYLELYTSTNYFPTIFKIFSQAIELKTQILLTPNFFARLYEMKKLYKFLSKMMIHNFDFYRHESVFSIYTDKLIISKTCITIDELLFLTLIYKHFKHIYIQKLTHYLKSRLKNIDSVLLSKVYFLLIRKIYNTEPSFFNKAFINRILNHPYGFYFCENLRELSYRNCFINKIKIDKLFNPF